MSFAKASTRLFAANIVTTLVSLGALSYFARRVGAEGIGVYVLFLALIGLLSMVADAGLGTATETRASEGKDSGTVFTTSALLSGAVAVVLSVGVFAFRETIAGFVGADVAVPLVVALILGQALKVVNSTLRGELRVAETAELSIARQVTWTSVGVAFVALGAGVDGLIYGYLAGIVTPLVWGFHKLDTTPGRPTWAMARSLLGYAKFNLVPTLSSQLTSWTDVLLIGWFLTRADVGTYEMAAKVAAVTLILVRAVGASVLPQVAAWRAQGETDRIGDLVTAAMTPSFLLVIPAFAGILVLAPTILSVGFGPEYAGGALVLVVLVAGKLSSAVRLTTGRALLGLDRPDLLARATTVQALLNVGLNVVFIWAFGLVGAAVATSAASAIGTVIVVRYLSAHVPIRFPTRELGWLTVSAAAMALVVWAVQAVAPAETPVALAGTIAIGAVSYGVFVLLWRPFRVATVAHARSMVEPPAGITPDAD